MIDALIGRHEDELLLSDQLILLYGSVLRLLISACCNTSITWCGKVYSHGQITHDREWLSGLASLRRSATAGKVVQFFQAVH